MTGRWIMDAPPDLHRCKQPWLLGRKEGRVWQCECGAVWRIVVSDAWGDYYKVWQRLPRDIAEVFLRMAGKEPVE